MPFFITFTFMIASAGVWFCVGALYMLQKTSKTVHDMHESAIKALNDGKAAIEAGQKLVDFQHDTIKKLAASNLELLKENDQLKETVAHLQTSAVTPRMKKVGRKKADSSL